MNLLFLMVDEMAWWALDSGVRTPALDALRSRGVTFSSAYTPSPMCVPARAALATGRYVHEIGTWSSAEPYCGVPPSWAHAVRAAGFDCVSIGKLHYRNGHDDTGFSPQLEPIHVPGGEGWVRGLLRRPLCDYLPTAELAQQVGPGDSAYHAFDRRVTGTTCDWLTDPSRGDRPWCAFVSWLSPHYPLVAPEADFALYDPTDFESDAEPPPRHPILNDLAGFFDHDRYFTPRTRGLARASYRALCTFVDRQIGKVLEALDASGQVDRTTILFASDHGEMLGRHGFWTKQVMYEDSARIPLLLAGPGIEPGSRDDPVSLIDAAPTIARTFGLSERPYSGRHLLDRPEGPRTVLSEYHDGGASEGMTMVRWNAEGAQWKYVHYAGGHRPQLFELAGDPDESKDIATARPDICAEALGRLGRWMDPEVVNTRAHADQSEKIRKLGGRAALLAREQWNYTPADSR